MFAASHAQWTFWVFPDLMACPSPSPLSLLKVPNVRNVPCFETVFQLKQHFLENCQAEISPATDTKFQICYYPEGNKKFSISSKIQLAEAFSLVKNGKITLWVDPHKDVPRSSLGRNKKGTENNNLRYLHILLLVRFSTDV